MKSFYDKRVTLLELVSSGTFDGMFSHLQVFPDLEDYFEDSFLGLSLKPGIILFPDILPHLSQQK